MRRRAAQGLPAKVPAPQPHVRDRTTLDPAKSHRRRRPRRVHDRVKGPLEAPHPGRTVILGRPLSPTCSGVGQAGCSDASMGSQRWQRFCTLPPSQVGIPDEDGGRGLPRGFPLTTPAHLRRTRRDRGRGCQPPPMLVEVQNDPPTFVLRPSRVFADARRLAQVGGVVRSHDASIAFTLGSD